jgi:hypothetical protein
VIKELIWTRKYFRLLLKREKLYLLRFFHREKGY